MEKEEFIRIKEWPTEYAQGAYNQGNYIEAIQVLHGLIETKLQELLILEGSKSNDMEEIWDIANQISLTNCVKVLFIIGEITKREYQDIIFFNKIRNQIVHGLFHDTYEHGVRGVSRKKFDIAFDKGMDLCDNLQRKGEMKIEKKNTL